MPICIDCKELCIDVDNNEMCKNCVEKHLIKIQNILSSINNNIEKALSNENYPKEKSSLEIFSERLKAMYDSYADINNLMLSNEKVMTLYPEIISDYSKRILKLLLPKAYEEKNSHDIKCLFSEIKKKYSFFKNKEKSIPYDKKFVELTIKNINPKYLKTSKLLLEINMSDTNSIKIKVENNSWRNDQIKGDLTFAKIKSIGDVSYIAFKNKFDYAFDKLDISYSRVKSDNLYLRIDLQEFEKYINDNPEKTRELLNSIFLDSISFPAFGCCSKYRECSEQHECLHNDPLYSTACQYKRIIERSAI